MISRLGSHFSKRSDAPEPGLSPAPVRNMYTTYCIKCYRITYSVDVLPLHWCDGSGVVCAHATCRVGLTEKKKTGATRSPETESFS